MQGPIDIHSGEFFTSAAGLEFLSPQGQATLAHLERVFQLPSPEQFQQMVANGDIGDTEHPGTCMCVCSAPLPHVPVYVCLCVCVCLGNGSE